MHTLALLTLAQDAPVPPEQRYQALMLLAMIIVIGLVGIFIVLGLMTAWRKVHAFQQDVEKDISNRRGKVTRMDTWKVAGERAPGADPDAPHGVISAEVLDDPDDTPADGDTPAPPVDPLDVEKGPPRFDTGTQFDDGYEDDDAEIDTGDNWKQGTDYSDHPGNHDEPDHDLADALGLNEDDGEVPDDERPFLRYRAEDRDDFDQLDDPMA